MEQHTKASVLSHCPGHAYHYPQSNARCSPGKDSSHDNCKQGLPICSGRSCPRLFNNLVRTVRFQGRQKSLFYYCT